MADIRSILKLGPVMPVVVIDDAGNAAPLAEALLDGGIKAIEVTLRTDAAIEAIGAVAKAVPGMTLGAGTVLDAATAKAARDAGAKFAVSPGATDALIEGCAACGLPLLPGAATPSEMMALAGKGFDALKFFPATQAGGVAYLKAVAGPLPDLLFCPTGGISAANAGEFLALANVGCVGGSWVADRGAIAEQDWEGITSRAREASGLRRVSEG